MDTDRRHGSYEPRDTVPIRDTMPSEVEITDCDAKPVQSDSPFTNREQVGKSNILSDALACTQGDRQAAYGSPAENWLRTVQIFNAMTGRDLTTDEGVKFAIAMKLARLQTTPSHRDSMVDLAGYAWVLSEVMNG